jgi:hypothetical protein
MSVAAQCIGFDCPNFLTRPSSEGVDQGSSRRIVERIIEEVSKLRGPESMTLGHPLEEVLTTLNEVYMECSQAGWDGYGASAVTEDAYEEARKIINLLPSSIRMPEIVAEPTGEIGFEWRRGRGQVFVLSVSGKHRITYAGIYGSNKIHGSEYFEETLPLVIINHLRRLYS